MICHVPVVHDRCSCGAATQGLQTFDHYQDPETGKQGKVNVGVTVGKYRGNKLVSVAGHCCFSVCVAVHATCSAKEHRTGHTSSVTLHSCIASLPVGTIRQTVPDLFSSSGLLHRALQLKSRCVACTAHARHTPRQCVCSPRATTDSATFWFALITIICPHCHLAHWSGMADTH